MSAQFSFLDVRSGEINPTGLSIIRPLEYKNISEINPADIDAIICLSSRKIFSGGKVIYLNALTEYFKRKTYVELPLLHFLQCYPQVKLILMKNLTTVQYESGAEINSQLYSIKQFADILSNDKSGNVKTPLNKLGYTNTQTIEITEAPKVKTNSDGSTLMEDTDENSLQRIKNGKRMTANQPVRFRNKIYFVGSCHHYGVHAPFDKTIESYLQQMLNEKNLPYRVENESQRYWSRYQDIFYNLNKLTPAPGDIIFIWIENLASNNFPFFNVANAFESPHDYRKIYCTQNHVELFKPRYYEQVIISSPKVKTIG